MKVDVAAHTPYPELAVAVAARACFSDQDYDIIEGQLRPADVDRILTTAISKGHHSVLEHANFTLAISGISRVVSHQLVRHRIASYSQLSQQRADASELQFVTPPVMRRERQLADRYDRLMSECQEFYRTLLEFGIPRGSARYVLPSSFQTRVVMTMNARSLMNLIAQRECAAEEWEFRQLAHSIHDAVMGVAPRIFKHSGTQCETHGLCPEGQAGLNCDRLRRTGASVENTQPAILHQMEV